MAMSKIKKNDTVRVIAGVDKGKEGKVIDIKDGKVKVMKKVNHNPFGWSC